MMKSKTCHYVLIIAIFWQFGAGTKLETLKKCCNLGTNYGNSGLKCSSFQSPIAGVAKEDEKLCLNSVDVCCKNIFREKQCKLGQADATSESTCTNLENDSEGFRKDCCEACQLGIETGATNQPCNAELGLGALSNSAFTACCNKRNDVTTTPAATSPTSVSTLVTNSIATTDTTTNNGFFKSKITKSLEKYDNISPPPPSLEALCEIPDLCAHKCIPTGDSYRCDCYDGFTLMADGISCKPSKRLPQNSHRCEKHNPCDQECTDTGVSIKCSCFEGYELTKDKRTCKDIDECALGIHECYSNEICVNLIGDYECQDDTAPETINDKKCPAGYAFDAKLMVCNDIDECSIEIICPNPSICTNTIGSYTCQTSDAPKCPPGFLYRDAIQNCEDIDECTTEKNDCNKESQICLNTKGNYTCIDKASKTSCPAGFKKNISTGACQDIDECEENDQLCAENEKCVNEPGGHNCILKLSTIITNRHPHTLSKIFFFTTTETPPTYRTSTQDISSISLSPSTTTEVQSTYRTSSQTVISTSQNPSTTTEIQSIYRTPIVPPFHPPNQFVTCSTGYKFSYQTNTCVDIDECNEDRQTCDSNQDCYNTIGSFICNCKVGFMKDFHTGACVDVNECQIGQHDCGDGQRCDNTIGSYLCARTTGCGTGYTLNFASGLCEDDDECVLGLNNCKDLGPTFRCRNTLGSYRCEKIKCVGNCFNQKIFTTTTNNSPAFTTSTQNYPVSTNNFKRCLPGYKMNQYGGCEDIDECSSNPCKRNEKCYNLSGRHQCVPLLQCRSGYEINEIGTECIDINECARGVHKCKSTQICKNGPGYYLCQCPPGHKLNADNECEDINECDFYRERICSHNAHCINTIGSYECKCKEGFKERGHTCEDINECAEIPNLCHQNCVNVWGSYRCSCERGFTLNKDNRTCTDIDECQKFQDKNLCVGTCQNTPGSYTCSCPDGYRRGSDGRTCQDIDECLNHVCGNVNDICINTRGSYKCYTLRCPPNYIKDPEHKSRCKRASNVCDIRDINCIRMPGQYSYHFVTFVSKLPIPEEGRIDFFQMKGPAWANSYANFNMNVKNLNCPRYVTQADERFFRMKRETNKVIVSLVRPIEGPQEIELQLQMELYMSGVFQGKVVSTILVYVSEYEF